MTTTTEYNACQQNIQNIGIPNSENQCITFINQGTCKNDNCKFEHDRGVASNIKIGLQILTSIPQEIKELEKTNYPECLTRVTCFLEQLRDTYDTMLAQCNEGRETANNTEQRIRISEIQNKIFQYLY